MTLKSGNHRSTFSMFTAFRDALSEVATILGVRENFQSCSGRFLTQLAMRQPETEYKTLRLILED